MSTRARLRLAVSGLAVVIAAAIVLTATRGGGASEVSLSGGGEPFSIVVPPDERAAQRMLTAEPLPAVPSLAEFLLIASLPTTPRLRRLETPAPPPRERRLHVAATRIALTSREAPAVPSDGKTKVSPIHTVAGALPDDFAFSYADGYHGWPVQPLHGPHVLHGGFNDPRSGGYHFGIDIAVDDSHPALEAPKGGSHRVYAVEGGIMHWARNSQTKPCNARRFDIGHFAYWHLKVAVPYGTRVRAGQMVGWTCLNEWHVHLSEWARVNGRRRWVNPLHPGGKLEPYVDDAAPKIRAVYAYGPPSTAWKPSDAVDLPNEDGAPPLGLRKLHGAVDLRAWIDDSQGILGVFAKQPDLASTTAPYKLWVQIRQVATNAIVWQRTTFQSDLLLTGVVPFFALYASGARPSLSDYQCLHSRIPCDGRLFYHLVVVGGRYLWDTRSVENGNYKLTIRAYDIKGNVSTRVAALRVRN